MNTVCFSTKEAFLKRCASVDNAIKHSADKFAIYSTPADENQTIGSQIGECLNLENSKIIDQTDIFSTYTINSGNFMARKFSIKDSSIKDLLDNLPNANYDELFLFMTLARPEILSTRAFMEVLANRLNELYEETIYNPLLTNMPKDKISKEHKNILDNAKALCSCMENVEVKVFGDVETYYPTQNHQRML